MSNTLFLYKRRAAARPRTTVCVSLPISRWQSSPEPSRSSKRHAVFARWAGAEDGMTLIEVIVSALLVGLVAIATLTGFNSVKRTTADERLHDQAAVLLAESQEQLRSDSAEVLDRI